MSRLSPIVLLLSACVQDVAMFAEDKAADASSPTTATGFFDVPITFDSAAFDSGTFITANDAGGEATSSPADAQ